MGCFLSARPVLLPTVRLFLTCSAKVRLLFDKMSQGETANGAVQHLASGSGGIESLPDGVIEHILGFLPSVEAVRTSVLARRWRHLWKSATVLWVGCCDPDEKVSVEDLLNLVNHLLLLRGGSPIEKCYFTFIAQLSNHDDMSHVNLWFRHVVMCKVRVLYLFMFGHSTGEPWLELDNLPLISQHLRRLDLAGVQVHNSFLNFSNCPALDHLKLSGCELSSINKIVSESLKHLIIILSIGSSDSRIHIYTPNVASLRLEHFSGRTPILDGMPSLLEASVQITGACRDRCTNANYFWTCDCESCDSSGSTANGSINCVLLRGLSEARILALRSASDMWFHKVEIKLCVSSMKRSTAISEHLKIVEIKCEVADDRVLKIMNFLSAFKICFSFEMKNLE